MTPMGPHIPGVPDDPIRKSMTPIKMTDTVTSEDLLKGYKETITIPKCCLVCERYEVGCFEPDGYLEMVDGKVVSPYEHICKDFQLKKELSGD